MDRASERRVRSVSLAATAGRPRPENTKGGAPLGRPPRQAVTYGPRLGGQDPDQNQDAKGGDQQDDGLVLLNDLHGLAPQRFVKLVKFGNSNCVYTYIL